MPKGLKSLITRFQNVNLITSSGSNSSIGDGIATIYGLDGVKAGELICRSIGAVVKGWP
jgi:F0F1-type ATP synthase alpha subunit